MGLRPVLLTLPPVKQLTSAMARYNENGLSFNLDHRQVESVPKELLKEGLGWTRGVAYVTVC